MKKEPEYFLVVASDGDTLIATVNKLLSEGWTLQGGAAVASHYASWENERKGYTESETYHTFTQAMIRCEETAAKQVPIPFTAEMVVIAHDEAGLYPPGKAQNTRTNMGKLPALALAEALNKVQQQTLKNKR